MSPEEKKRRFDRIREFMERERLDSLLIHGREGFNSRGNIRYVTGYGINIGEQFCIFPLHGEPVFFGSKNANYHVQKIGWITHCVEAVEPQEQIIDYLQELSRGNSIGVPNVMNLPVSVYLSLERHFGGRVKDVTELFRALRIVKSEEEMEKIRTAASVADKVYNVLRRLLKPGVSDYEIYGEIKREIHRMGCEYSMDFIDVQGNTVNLSNPRGNLTRADTVVAVETTPSFEGYYAQLAMALPVLEFPKKLRHVFSVWQKAIQAGETLLVPGTRISDIYEKVTSTISGYGYTCPLRLGHAIGLDVIDFFSISKDEGTKLVPGMVLAFHPCVMKETMEGIGMGYTYVIRDDGFERLNKVDLCMVSG
jgi:Xaa-Pro aminopeptidase